MGHSWILCLIWTYCLLLGVIPSVIWCFPEHALLQVYSFIVTIWWRNYAELFEVTKYRRSSGKCLFVFILIKLTVMIQKHWWLLLFLSNTAGLCTRHTGKATFYHANLVVLIKLRNRGRLLNHINQIFIVVQAVDFFKKILFFQVLFQFLHQTLYIVSPALLFTSKISQIPETISETVVSCCIEIYVRFYSSHSNFIKRGRVVFF